MKAKLFETLVSDIMADPYKFKKSESTIYRRDGDSTEEPNIAHYYDRMDEIVSYMEENVKL